MEVDKGISDLQKKHLEEVQRFNALLNDKDTIIREMEKQVADLKDKLKKFEGITNLSNILSKLQILEKEYLSEDLSDTTKRIEKLIIEKLKLLHPIKRYISDSTSTNTRPLVPVASTRRKLIFFSKGERTGYDLNDLLKAPAKELGKGTFGTSYQVSIQSGEIIVVKRIKKVNVPEKEFSENIARIGELKHNNILPLLAYDHSEEEALLVCDFLSKGSLSAALYGNVLGQEQLDWETRKKIIISVSNATNYIHSMGPASCHGNIKSSNVLLHPTYVARLSDAGLYSLATISSPRSTCYCAPEITDLGKMSQKADVYSFGLLLLELMTGKSPSQEILNEDGMDLVTWVRSFERVEETFDVELVHDQSVRKDMMQLMQLALSCMDDNPVNWPTMADVVVTIEDVLKINDS